jgi:hypothetical protein
MFSGIGDHWRVWSWQDREHQAVDAVSGRCQQVLFKSGKKIKIFLSLTSYFHCSNKLKLVSFLNYLAAL